MQALLLATNLFALTALLVGLNSFSKDSQSWRLLPLFLLVATRAVMVIVSFNAPAGQSGIIPALDVFSVFYIIWALMPNPAQIRPVFLWTGTLAGGILALLPALPGWPAPFQLHSIIILVAGAWFIVSSLPRFNWLCLLAPLALLLANFLALLQLTGFWGLITLLAYALLIASLHWEGMQIYRGRQVESEATARQAVHLSRERQRLLDVGRIISAIPSLSQSMSHVARCMATVTRADQAALLVIDALDASRFYLAAVYSPERPITLVGRYQQRLPLADFKLLGLALSADSPALFAPQSNPAELAEVYTLWFEDRIGPAYLQPLLMNGRPVGLLLLGNPVTQDRIQPNDMALCRHLAPQLAALVEAYRYYGEGDPHPPVLAVAPQPEPALVGAAVTEANAPRPRLNKPAPRPGPPALPAEPVTGTFDHMAIFEAIHEGVVVSDATGRVRLVNRAAERILGRSRRELLGQPISSVYGQIDSAESIEDLATAFSRRNKPLPTFAQYDDRFVQGQLVPWRNNNNEWLGIIAIFKDVTPNVKADEARNNFITALSRELRAPLTTIKGYSELILRGSIDDYTPDQLHIQQIMHSSVDRIVAVLDNAIQLGAQNKNKIVPHFAQVDVMAVIDEALQKMASLAHVQEVTLTKETKSELPPIIADRAHLLRILENLLENACLYTPPGGYVSVRAWVQHERADSALQPELVLMVADNGVGIPTTEQRRIFEPFYQIPGALEARGMGMGLTVVKELVEGHKGRVWVESVVNEGSVFQVALPLTQN